MAKMKVQNFYEPLVMKYEEHDIPEIADNEVLVNVKAVGICGSDVSYYYGHSPLGTASGKGPLYLGHEASGVIAKVGSIPAGLGLFKEGDRVAINPVQQCNACPACMRGEFNVCGHSEVIGVSVNGCFAEYVKVKFTHAYKIPDEVSFESAALAEPLACSTHGVKLLNVQLGQTAVVYGLGSIGLMMVQLVKASGAGKVIAIGAHDFGLDKAKELGATHLINSRETDSPYYAASTEKKVAEINGGEKAPRCIVATSNMGALQDALRITGLFSTVVYFGLPGPQDELKIPVLDAIQSERTVKFSWLAPLVWDNVFDVIASGQVRLDTITTHKFSLADTEKGIKFMKEGKENKIKGLVLVD
ncbi:MAG: alcohol dehydrogenase catalytic domain-containing protein [Spirochaetaceae bacterium]|jgi:L-iditol 2-dehydrogenase|nr:alcohol dehydrogenase catalytic domain-containing protein [Spirochaetaceae bacterium]